MLVVQPCRGSGRWLPTPSARVPSFSWARRGRIRWRSTCSTSRGGWSAIWRQSSRCPPGFIRSRGMAERTTVRTARQASISSARRWAGSVSPRGSSGSGSGWSRRNLGRRRLDERDAERRCDLALGGESGGAEQTLVLPEGPLLPAKERQHVNVEHLRPVRPWVVRDDLLDQEEHGVRGRGTSDRLQDGLGLRVGPVVDDLHDDVGVAFRKRVLEEVPGQERKAIRGGGSGIGGDMRQIEKNTLRL